MSEQADPMLLRMAATGDASEVLEHCSTGGFCDLLRAHTNLLTARYTRAGVYLLLVSYPDETFGVYIGKTGRNMGERFLEHRRQFQGSDRTRLVYRRQAASVWALPLFLLPDDMEALYVRLTGEPPSMTPKQLGAR